jgi:ATP-binding cassette subfamily B protein
MVAAWYGKTFPIAYFRRICHISKQGTTLAGLAEAAKHIGVRSLPAEVSLALLIEKAPLPCILHWEKAHYVVLTHIDPQSASIADPSLDRIIKLNHRDFLHSWQIHQDSDTGRALFLEPTEAFHQLESQNEKTSSLWSLVPYIHQHKAALLPLILSILTACIFSLVIPVLTQQIVDRGIKEKNVNILLLICLAQLMLFVGKTAMDFLRSRWLFRIGARTSIALLKSFLSRLMLLPFSFFDNRQAGDNMQRVTDNQRVEDFLTGSVINFVLSILTLLVLGGVLLFYDWRIFLLFLTGAVLSLVWSVSFQQKRKLIDQKKFKVLSANQQLLLEIFYAMQEIKLTGSGEEKKQNWESLQDQSYGLKLESLQLDQFMQGIGTFINEIKNVLISFTAAMLVVNNHISLGAMLAITYICGQLNTPVIQLVEFIRAAQNTRFSLQRMSEVYQEPEEDFQIVPVNVRKTPSDIIISNMYFKYGHPFNPFVLRNINLTIPAGKVTAIVGMSGSGKSTLIKLLLKFYQLTDGRINIGEQPLDEIHAVKWRERCGVVMQDGYVFSDTVANNIYAGGTKDENKLIHAAILANMHDFFLEMPFGYDTVIGKDGYGLSEGQKQRLLIARLIYRNPSYIFLDEATNSLDANNERTIVNNLNKFFSGKTVLVVAHRLSTVRNADQIIVMHEGEITEAGTHEQLITTKGSYYHLIKNQLELGK